MKKKLFLIVISVLLLISLLSGCTESLSQKAIDTDFSNKQIVSNGGLSVKYGKYLYYINGLAGASAANEFGTPQKGAIARVELDAKGLPILNTNKIIVPKNVHGSKASNGLYIVGDYIYYSTPNVEKDKNGTAKTSEMIIMSTKLDGTETKVIKEFDDYAAEYKVVGNYLMYYINNELHEINLASKKLDDKLISDKVVAYKFTPNNDLANDFKDAVVYTKASEDETAYHNEVFIYRAGGEAKKIITKASYENLLQENGYQITIVDVVYIANNQLRLIYNKTDGGTNKKSTGTYSVDLDSTLTFVESKEVRYSSGQNYLSFYFFDSNNMIALDDKKAYFLTKNGDTFDASYIMEKVITIFDVTQDTSSGLVTLWYLEGNVLKKLPILKLKDGVYTLNIIGTSIVFNTAYNSSWLPIDKVDSVIYFFNTNLKDNVCYLDLSAVIERNPESMTANLMGLLTMEDKIALI